MEHKTRTKALSWLLSIALVLSLMPGMSLTAYAETDTYTALKNNATVVQFNGYNWYIIEDNSTSATEGTVTLLAADDKFGLSKFSDSDSTAYSSSKIKVALDAMTVEGGAFADVANAIVSTDLDDVSVTGVKLYLLSTEEAKSLPENVRKAEFTGGDCNYNEWWLRSAGRYDRTAACVFGKSGNVIDDGGLVGYTYGVRPALKLNLSSVSFSYNTNTFTVGSASSYSVTYNTNGGTINSGNITEYTEGTGATLPTDVTKEGYVFGGWYDNEGLTGSSVSEISETDTGDKEYWAMWVESLVGKTYPVDGTGNLVIERATRFADGQGSTCTVSPGTYAISFDNLTDNPYLYRLSGNKIYITHDTTKRIKALTIVEGTGLPGNPYVFAFLYDDPISYTVTFSVVNGSWDDDSTANKTVSLTGYEGDMLKLTADQIPAVGTKPNDSYKAGSWDTTPSADTEITADTTYMYT